MDCDKLVCGKEDKEEMEGGGVARKKGGRGRIRRRERVKDGVKKRSQEGRM